MTKLAANMTGFKKQHFPMVVLGTVLASGLSVLSWSEGGFLSLPHHWLLTAPERYV